jgi:hypothetical protein
MHGVELKHPQKFATAWTLFLEKVAFFGAFAESGFGEVDVVDVGAGSWRVLG